MGPVLSLAQQTPIDVSAWLIGTPVTVLAFGILAFVRGWIVSGPTHNRILAKLDEQAAEIRQLHATMAETVVPALTRATDVLVRAEQERRP